MLLIRISGDVIGVGFRATSQRLATQLNLTGYVRNMSDQTVEIGLDNHRDDANALIDHLKSSDFTHIDHITITEYPGSTNSSGFEVR